MQNVSGSLTIDLGKGHAHQLTYIDGHGPEGEGDRVLQLGNCDVCQAPAVEVIADLTEAINEIQQPSIATIAEQVRLKRKDVTG